MKKKAAALIVLLLTGWLGAALLQSCYKPAQPQCRYYGHLHPAIIDNADSLPHDVVNNAVIAKAMILSVQVDDSFGYYCRRPFSLIPCANACKPDNSAAPLEETVGDVTISSNHNFDAQHAAGSSLNDLFYYAGTGFPQPENTYRYYLRSAPADTGTHIFTVQFTLTNGRLITASSLPVKLLL